MMKDMLSSGKGCLVNIEMDISITESENIAQ